MEQKTIDTIIYELVARGALAASGVPQDADKLVQKAKEDLAEWIRSKKPDGGFLLTDLRKERWAGIEEFEQSLLADLEEDVQS